MATPIYIIIKHQSLHVPGRVDKAEGLPMVPNWVLNTLNPVSPELK
jgi:hypothetical protein